MYDQTGETHEMACYWLDIPSKEDIKKRESHFCEETNEYWMLTNKCLKSKRNYTLRNWKKQKEY